MDSGSPNRIIRFGSVEVDLETGELHRRGLRIRLQEQPFQVLKMLLEHPGHVVTREALQQKLWPDQTFVDFDQGLNRAINKLREALGESADRPRYIETLPKRGYRFIAALRQTNDLELAGVTRDSKAMTRSSVHEVPDKVGSTVPRRREKSDKPAVITAVSATALLAVIAVLALLELTVPKKTGASIDRMKFTRLTTNGRIRGAAISPSGKYLAYAMDEEGKEGLWMNQMATGSNVRIVPPADCDYWGLTFSGDGESVYCVRYEKGNSRGVLYQVPVLGGEPQRLCEGVESPVTISPDGKRLAFVSRSTGRGEHILMPGRGEDSLIIMNLRSREERDIATRKLPDFFSIDGPAWSPDGRLIATAAGSYTGSLARSLVAVGVDGSPMRPLCSWRWWYIGQVDWLRDRSGLVMAASDKASLGNFQIWEVSYPNGEVHRITNDLNDYDDVSLTSDSKSLVTLQYQELSGIYVAQNRDPTSSKRITTGAETHAGVYGLSWTPDHRIVYSSSASENLHLWITNPADGSPRQLTAGPFIDAWPSVCPDGRYVFFVSFRTGSPNIWRINIDGSDPRQMTHDDSDFAPSCSPDGKWVVYQSSHDGLQTVYRVPTDGGDPTRLSEKPAYGPDVSPDGKRLACIYRGGPDSPFKIAILPITGGSPIKMLEVPPSARLQGGEAGLHWTPDGQALAYVDERHGVGNIWALPLTGGASSQLTHFDSTHIFFFAWSRKDKTLALSRGTTTADAVMISNFKQ